MNVIFHTLGSIATAAVLSAKPGEKTSNLKKLAVGFFVGILLHGILDLLPHNYPLSSTLDVFFTLFLLALTIFLAQKQNRILILVCFVGAIFPDLVDLGAEIANKHLGIPFPQFSFKIFPWHWKEYSGSIYDGTRNFESLIYHSLVFLISFLLIYFYRNKLFSNLP
ncbi:MAG: hypothetical protein ABJA66_11865 [Actinomycetota bacterium]